jgi:hypothetical protein
VRAQALLLFLGGGHFLGVGCHPQRAAVGELAGRLVGRHAWAPLVPEVQGRLAQRQFGRVVVHHHEVAHARVGGAALACVDHMD